VPTCKVWGQKVQGFTPQFTGTNTPQRSAAVSLEPISVVTIKGSLYGEAQSRRTIQGY